MSEFVQCQNCGKRYFAEHLDCPYCKDEQDLQDLIDEVQGTVAPAHRMFRALLFFFEILLAFVGLFALASAARATLGQTRVALLLEGVSAIWLLVGLVRRRRWARRAAIVLITANAGLGLLAIASRGRLDLLLWGPGPLAMLLFLIPFLGLPAREHLKR